MHAKLACSAAQRCQPYLGQHSSNWACSGVVATRASVKDLVEKYQLKVQLTPSSALQSSGQKSSTFFFQNETKFINKKGHERALRKIKQEVVKYFERA